MLDVNVVLDILLQRKGFQQWINIIEAYDFLFVSILSVNNISYICRKEKAHLHFLDDFLSACFLSDAKGEDYGVAQKLFVLHEDMEDCLLLAGCQRNALSDFVTGDEKLVQNAGQLQKAMNIRIISKSSL